MRLLELPVRPTEIAELQAASAIGQGRLYRTYDELLRELGLQTRAGAADLLRHERADALPERAAHAADAARLADRPRHQRERHDDDGRDLLRRQRLPRRPGRGTRRRAAARAADRHRRPLHRRSPHRPCRRARRGGPAAGGGGGPADRPCGLAARLGRDALQGRGGRDGDGRGNPDRDRQRARGRCARAALGRRAGGHPVPRAGRSPLELQAVAQVREALAGHRHGRRRCGAGAPRRRHEPAPRGVVDVAGEFDAGDAVTVREAGAARSARASRTTRPASCGV